MVSIQRMVYLAITVVFQNIPAVNLFSPLAVSGYCENYHSDPERWCLSCDPLIKYFTHFSIHIPFSLLTPRRVGLVNLFQGDDLHSQPGSHCHCFFLSPSSRVNTGSRGRELVFASHFGNPEGVTIGHKVNSQYVRIVKTTSLSPSLARGAHCSTVNRSPQAGRPGPSERKVISTVKTPPSPSRERFKRLRYSRYCWPVSPRLCVCCGDCQTLGYTRLAGVQGRRSQGVDYSVGRKGRPCVRTPSSAFNHIIAIVVSHDYLRLQRLLCHFSFLIVLPN
ncbi:hypothetical protein J6590_020831 [Homalodisca vitripennis]|nr:hypothetical protein J6590_020831 [Homalodisca vitripennis]